MRLAWPLSLLNTSHSSMCELFVRDVHVCMHECVCMCACICVRVSVCVCVCVELTSACNLARSALSVLALVG